MYGGGKGVISVFHYYIDDISYYIAILNIRTDLFVGSKI